mgnify:CR=1 FL=1
MVVIRRDPERLKKLRAAIRYLLREDALERGHQTRLAEHFSVSRQRVNQVVTEEERRRAESEATREQFAEPATRLRAAPAPQTPPLAAPESPGNAG